MPAFISRTRNEQKATNCEQNKQSILLSTRLSVFRIPLRVAFLPPSSLGSKPLLLPRFLFTVRSSLGSTIVMTWGMAAARNRYSWKNPDISTFTFPEPVSGHSTWNTMVSLPEIFLISPKDSESNRHSPIDNQQTTDDDEIDL